MLRSDPMSVTIAVSVNLVSEGEYRVSIPLAPSSSAPGKHERGEGIQREDKVLPLGSSTLSPGLRLPLAD